MAKIGNILRENGIFIQKVIDKKGELVDLHLVKTKVPISTKKEVPYVSFKAHWKIIDTKAQEEKHKAINAGYDPDYILKSSKEMGKREPTFDMVGGIPHFVSEKH